MVFTAAPAVAQNPISVETIVAQNGATYLKVTYDFSVGFAGPATVHLVMYDQYGTEVLNEDFPIYDTPPAGGVETRYIPVSDLDWEWAEVTDQFYNWDDCEH